MWERKCIHFRSDILYDYQFENILNNYPDWQLVGVVPMESGKFKFMAFMQRQMKATGGLVTKGKEVKK